MIDLECVNKENFLCDGWVGNCYNCNGDLIGYKDSFNCLYNDHGYIGHFEKSGELFNFRGDYIGELVDIEVGLMRMVFDRKKQGVKVQPIGYQNKSHKIFDEGARKISVPNGYEDFKI